MLGMLLSGYCCPAAVLCEDLLSDGFGAQDSATLNEFASQFLSLEQKEPK